jgi:hypothetical protein
LGFFPWFLPTQPCTLRSTQPLKMSTRDFSLGKGGRCIWLTTYHPCSAESREDPFTLYYILTHVLSRTPPRAIPNLMKIRAQKVALLHVDGWKDRHGEANGQLRKSCCRECTARYRLNEIRRCVKTHWGKIVLRVL